MARELAFNKDSTVKEVNTAQQITVSDDIMYREKDQRYPCLPDTGEVPSLLSGETHTYRISHQTTVVVEWELNCGHFPTYFLHGQQQIQGEYHTHKHKILKNQLHIYIHAYFFSSWTTADPRRRERWSYCFTVSVLEEAYKTSIVCVWVCVRWLLLHKYVYTRHFCVAVQTCITESLALIKYNYSYEHVRTSTTKTMLNLMSNESFWTEKGCPTNFHWSTFSSNVWFTIRPLGASISDSVSAGSSLREREIQTSIV